MGVLNEKRCKHFTFFTFCTFFTLPDNPSQIIQVKIFKSKQIIISTNNVRPHIRTHIIHSKYICRPPQISMHDVSTAFQIFIQDGIRISRYVCKLFDSCFLSMLLCNMCYRYTRVCRERANQSRL